MDSPLLRPYPSWEWHQFHEEIPPKIVSPFRIRADSCDRLWVLDSGYIDVLNKTVGTKPRLLIFNLKNDSLIVNYTLPDDQFISKKSLFCNIVVEENNCTDSFAYLADTARPAMVVYSFENNRSWVLQHPFFNFSPLAGNMTVRGVSF